MNNLLVFPLFIPLFTAAVLIFLHGRVAAERWISGVSAVVNIAVACVIVGQVKEEGIQTLYMGGWLPPFGIVFVADMLSALLVLAAAVIAAGCLFYAFFSMDRDRERHYFYPLVQFLLAGVYGSFLTGDIFNLFVCFEVMLMASYALMVLGGTKQQLRETLQYLLINIVASTLFVASLAYLYGALGTLNMAHLSVRVAEAGQGGILNVIAVLLLIVFALKAGLLLFFWLPGSYGAPPAAVRALFGALLTKVGLYAIIRTFTLIFYHEPQITHTLIGFMSAATMILGGLGAAGYKDVPRMINYNVLIGVGFVGFGLSVASPEALDGVVLYLLHDMLAKALLFLLGGVIIAAAGSRRLEDMGGLIKRYPLAGWMFFALALALVGVPPLSGFPGKLLMLRGGFMEGEYVLSAIGLASSFLVLYSLMKLFRSAFWGEEKAGGPSRLPQARLKGMTAVSAGLLVLLVLFGVGAEWVYSYASEAGRVLSNPELYIEAVLRGETL